MRRGVKRRETNLRTAVWSGGSRWIIEPGGPSGPSSSSVTPLTRRVGRGIVEPREHVVEARHAQKSSSGLW